MIDESLLKYYSFSEPFFSPKNQTFWKLQQLFVVHKKDWMHCVKLLPTVRLFLLSLLKSRKQKDFQESCRSLIQIQLNRWIREFLGRGGRDGFWFRCKCGCCGEIRFFQFCNAKWDSYSKLAVELDLGGRDLFPVNSASIESNKSKISNIFHHFCRTLMKACFRMTTVDFHPQGVTFSG